MELYLMQHGQAAPEAENPEQPLSREGIAQIKSSAAAMKRMGIAFDVIVCSPKKRSRQSAALVAEGVNYPYSDIIETEKVKATATVDEAISFLRGFGKEKRVLVAGHLPSLARIASLLLGGGQPVRVRFENGGLCRIDAEELTPGEGEMVFQMPAAQMKMLAG
jgi:phosphohistidine phosphatase